MSESVDILIKAEDLATPVIKQSAKAVDGLDLSIKRTGETTKKSTDLLRAMSSVFGGSEFGRLAGQFGELTEKTSQFTASTNATGTGVVAFLGKLGAIAAVGTTAYAISRPIGDLIFETKKWEESLANANEKMKELFITSMRMSMVKLSDQRAEIATIQNPTARLAGYADLAKNTADQVKKVSDEVKKSTKDVAAWDAAWLKFGNRAAFAEQAKIELALKKQLLEALKGQKEELDRMPRQQEIADLGNARQFIQSLKDEIRLLSVVASERERVKALQAIPLAGPEQAEALKLVNLKEQLRVTELIRTETQRLKFEEMQLQAGGKERVDSLKLQEQGLAKDQADRLAAEQTRIDRLKQGMEAKPLLQGKDERLLTRGTVDPALKVAKEQLEELKSIGELLAEQEEKKTPTSSESTSFVVVQ